MRRKKQAAPLTESRLNQFACIDQRLQKQRTCSTPSFIETCASTIIRCTLTAIAAVRKNCASITSDEQHSWIRNDASRCSVCSKRSAELRPALSHQTRSAPHNVPVANLSKVLVSATLAASTKDDPTCTMPRIASLTSCKSLVFISSHSVLLVRHECVCV